MKKEFKSVLVICIANPSKNPRPNRIIKLLLRMGYEVDTCSYKSNGDLNISNEYIFEEINSNFFERKLAVSKYIIHERGQFVAFSLRKATSFLIQCHFIN